MPTRPPPRTFRCTQCSWSKTVAPRSDALRLGEFFSCCPSCGCETLRVTPANAASVALAAGAQAWERIFRR